MAQSAILSRAVVAGALTSAATNRATAASSPKSAIFGSSLRVSQPAFVANNRAGPFRVVAKAKTEDGIFGTSGGFGFTKANELFVGRMAMLGFAASLLGEAITGQGILNQLKVETGIPLNESEPLLIFFIIFTVLGAIGGLGDRGKFVDDEPAGIEGEQIKFGFTKANELFVGRMAQLGFAASLIGEVITGKGALAQLNIETGVPLFELEPLVLFQIIFFFIAAINPGTGKFINDDDDTK